MSSILGRYKVLKLPQIPRSRLIGLRFYLGSPSGKEKGPEMPYPLPVLPSSSGYRNERYVSYWNAVSSFQKFNPIVVSVFKI